MAAALNLFVPMATFGQLHRIPVSTFTVAASMDKSLATFMADESYPSFIGAVRVGQYGYMAGEYGEDDSGLWIYKVDLSTFTYIGACFLDSSLVSSLPAFYSFNAHEMCADPAGENLYVQIVVGSEEIGTLAIYKIQLSDFTVIDSIDYTSAWSSVSAAYYLHDLWACDGTHLYAYSEDASTSETHLTRFLASDLSFVDSWNATTSGYANLSVGVFDSGYLYCGATALGSPNIATLLKFELTGLTVDDEITHSESGSSYNDWASSLTLDDGYLYVATAGDGPSGAKSLISKIDLATFTVDTADDLNAEEQRYPTAGVIDGGTLYLMSADAVGGSNDLTIYEVDTATLTVTEHLVPLSDGGYTSATLFLYMYGAAASGIRARLYPINSPTY